MGLKQEVVTLRSLVTSRCTTVVLWLVVSRDNSSHFLRIPTTPLPPKKYFLKNAGAESRVQGSTFYLTANTLQLCRNVLHEQ